MKVAHLTTVDMSLRFLLLPQLEAALEYGESIGISAPGPYVSEIEERGIRHVPLGSSTRGMDLVADLRAMRQLWSVLRSEQLDVLHTHNPKPGVYGRILGRIAGVPLVVNTVHGLYATAESPLWKRALIYGLEGVASRFSDAELVQNPEDLELLRRMRLVPSRKLRLLGNGVDLSRFNPERARSRRDQTRAELGLDPDDVAVGMVGRLVAEKGLPELIEAARILGSRARVLVAGPRDPEKGDALQSEMLERASETGVRFLGMRRDVEALYGALDVFVLPSHREGFPRAAMEAAACGLPLVATDIRGCRQVVEDGLNGYLVPVGDPLRLAEALRALCDDPGMRERMGKASAEKARESFDESRVVEIVMTTYRDVARGKGLGWRLGAGHGDPITRAATVGDAQAVARLHQALIDTGFLSSLGTGFLRVLYRALITSERGIVIVAETAGTVVGFVAGTDRTRAFYKEFARSNLISAAWRLLPSLLRPGTWKRAWETLRYGGEGGTVASELLSMAVAPAAQGRGLGSRLVEELQRRAGETGVREMKVVVGKDNTAAIALYERCGFSDTRSIEVHTGVPSLEMVWRS